MRPVSRLALPAIAIALAVSASAQTLPPGVTRQASMGGITEYRYANGLRVLLYPDPANPKVTINITYLVGSRHEGYGESGMAHLLEHMDFIETTNGRQIKREITDHGAAWNGTTSDDRTNYFETVPASDENLKWALGLETDRMIHVKFTKQILDTEMTVVRNEFERGENSPQSILRERVAATAFLWHNYGKSTIGSKEDIERVPVERLAAFYRKYYRPDNAVLVVTGRLDEAKTLQFVAETLGSVPKPAAALEQTYTVEPPQDGERFVELRRVGEGPEVVMAYHGPSAGHPDAAALQVLAGIMSGARAGRGGFGGGFGGSAAEGRLTKALVDSKKAVSANMSFEQLHDPGLIYVSATLTNDESLDEARKIIVGTIAGVVSEPPTKEEIDRVKTTLVRGLERSLADPQMLATGALNTAIAQGDWRLMFLQHDRLAKVTADDVVRVAREYFKASNRTVGYYIPDANPDRTMIPAAPDLEATLRDYKSTVTISRGENFDPTPAHIEGRLVRSKLANGMKLVVLPKQTAAGVVSATLELRFGDAESLKGRNAAAQLAGAMLMSGTKNKSRQQVQDEMRKLDTTILVTGGGGGGFGAGRGGRGGPAVGGGINSASATISAPAGNFVAALRLAVEMLKEPAYPETDFDRMHSQRVRMLETPQTEPVLLSAETLQRHLSPWSKDDVLYPAPREEQAARMKQATLDDVRQFHDRFYGANFGILAVVGAVDQAALRTAAEELLGSWNTEAPYKPLVAPFKPAVPVNLKIETPDKANAQFEAGEAFRMAEDDADYPAMMLAGYLFGGPITSRVSDRIRNREGLSYGANARVAVPVEGEEALLSATVSLNPANGPKVESSFVDELGKTLREGFTEKEVAEGKKAYLDSRAVSRTQDAALVSLLLSHEQQGRTMKWDDELEKKIAELTAAQVNEAFRKHIDPAHLSIVKAGDFKAAGVYR
jgi:zinc protease